jgi:hypothetical protein
MDSVLVTVVLLYSVSLVIQETGEVQHQPWCCGEANHFDISFW